MTRNAKLFFLSDMDWKPLIEAAQSHRSAAVRNDLAIFEVIPDSGHLHFAILSVSTEVDALIEQYGGIPGSEKDMLIPVLKKGGTRPLFGDKSLTAFLNW